MIVINEVQIPISVQEAIFPFTVKNPILNLKL